MINADAKDADRLIASYKAAGITPIIGISMQYVSGRREQFEEVVEKVISKYPDAAGFSIYRIGHNINAPFNPEYYRSIYLTRVQYIYEYIKSKNPNYLVIMDVHPLRRSFYKEADNSDIEKAANFADILVTNVTDAGMYLSPDYEVGGAWVSNPANSNRIMHIVNYTYPEQYNEVIRLSRRRNAQWLFVNDWGRIEYNKPVKFDELVRAINTAEKPEVYIGRPLITRTPTATASATPSATAAANNAGNPFINRANNAANNLQNALQKQQDQLNAIDSVKVSARRDANGKVNVDNGKGPDVDKAQKAPTKSLAGKNGGLMLDVARQFYTVEELKGFINDVAAANGKFFHLHLSDNENFALESEILGQTAEKATRSRDGVYTGPLGNNFYSKEQIRQLAQYASSRGVELVPEVDLPGHSAFIYELLSKSNPKLAKQAFGGDSQAATKFAQDLYLEVAKQFTGSRHFHMGGDDFTGAVEQNASYISYVNANANALKAKGFTPRIWNDGVLVSSLGKLDKAVEITYHVSGGEKASITNLIGSGYKVINYGGRTDNAVEGTALAVWSKNGKAVSGDNLRTKLQRQIAPASNSDEDASNPNGGANKR